ncbi:REP-associated tyrosine transposase [Acidicapsa acidisoli]|uniref:REP-associated tyrosine transposase n=1 Tax=Acidicapsa acidisoli TaxID=1615681 RepID=UPI00295B46AF|nr:transposase [Acidicapsa acidisoli]
MIPKREVATNNGQTYFVTSNTAERRSFFRHERWAKLFLETLYNYRPERYLLHGFVLMPDHFHVLITPRASLEFAVQCLKGGFSFRAKRELGWMGEVWVAGFSDHRIRDDEDYRTHLAYIARNPVKARLVEQARQYPYSSANGEFDLDSFPRGLKPRPFKAKTIREFSIKRRRARRHLRRANPRLFKAKTIHVIDKTNN